MIIIIKIKVAIHCPPLFLYFRFIKIQLTAFVQLFFNPDWVIFCTLGIYLKPSAPINLPKSPTCLGNFCKAVKIYHFYSEIIFGQLLQRFGDFFLVTLNSPLLPLLLLWGRQCSWTSPSQQEVSILQWSHFYAFVLIRVLKEYFVLRPERPKYNLQVRHHLLPNSDTAQHPEPISSTNRVTNLL